MDFYPKLGLRGFAFLGLNFVSICSIRSTIVRWPDPSLWEIIHTYRYTVISIGLLAGIAGRVTEKWQLADSPTLDLSCALL